MNWSRRVMATVTGVLTACLIFNAPGAQAHRPAHRHPNDIGRQVLAAGDGWGSAGAGTSGGSAADRRHLITVHNREELARAVAGDAPKIVYVAGRIDANTDARGHRLSCDDYARNGYTLQAYLQAYDPAVWGRESEPSGPVEDARRASQQAQAARIDIPVGSNTTIIGRRGASITGAMLDLSDVSNVIIRGLRISDAFDCFPSWDPTDGDTGNWNSEYDTVSLRGSANVWVDHNDFSDADHPDSDQPLYFGRPYQVHDGLLDITNGSDLVTVSYNRFHDHDKTMLIGSSDSRTSDRGKLRVTLHHNQFRDLGQRVPRVRYGQVDVYNNSYLQDADSAMEYIYSWGVGVASHIVAEHNAFTLPGSVPLDQVVGNYKGTQLTENDNLVNRRPTDLLGIHNRAQDPDIAEVPPWSPLLRRHVDPVRWVPWIVAHTAGPAVIARSR